jgi:hypothetical protein
MDWIDLAHDRDERRPVVNTVTNIGGGGNKMLGSS